MIRDQHIKRLFIPLIGFCFPLLAGLINVRQDSALHILFTMVVFTGVVFLIWTGLVRLLVRLRTDSRLQKKFFLRIVSLSLASLMFGAALGFVSSAAWMRLGMQPFSPLPVLRATLIAGIGGTILTLMYEVVFLGVERELDSRVLQQIDRERQEAEMNVLKSELDPHFFFNCMNTLLYLVKEDKEKAHHFVHKLSSIYKYFLRNKEVDYVLLEDELEFLENYYYLLRIRFDDNIRIDNSIDPQTRSTYILPCTLQVLVENAMKHNFFSEKEPLVVSLAISNQHICVSNPVRPKLHAADSTKVGLRNLKARYRLITNQNVLVQKTANKFLVKLPIVKQTNYHDKSSDH